MNQNIFKDIICPINLRIKYIFKNKLNKNLICPIHLKLNIQLFLLKNSNYIVIKMKIGLLSFIMEINTQRNFFTSYDLKNKHKSGLLYLFNSLELIQVVGSYRRAKKYNKTENFDSIPSRVRQINSEEITQLLLAFTILNSDKLSTDKYNGKLLRKSFGKGARIISYLLFQNGLVFKKKTSYEYTKMFHHLIKQTKEERDNLLHNLIVNYDKEEQILYLSSLRSIRYHPDHVIISFDHGIALKTNWVIKHWKKGNLNQKNRELNDLAKNHKDLILFEADRITRSAKFFITIFPRMTPR